MGVYKRASAKKVRRTSCLLLEVNGAEIRFQAVSLAGHFGLDNLILIYDNNGVTVDGSINSCFTDDTSAKFRAQGWEVIDVFDGSNDVGENNAIGRD